MLHGLYNNCNCYNNPCGNNSNYPWSFSGYIDDPTSFWVHIGLHNVCNYHHGAKSWDHNNYNSWAYAGYFDDPPYRRMSHGLRYNSAKPWDHNNHNSWAYAGNVDDPPYRRMLNGLHNDYNHHHNPSGNNIDHACPVTTTRGASATTRTTEGPTEGTTTIPPPTDCTTKCVTSIVITTTPKCTLKPTTFRLAATVTAGAQTTWVVPACATEMQIAIAGGGGGNAYFDVGGTMRTGVGGLIRGSIPVSPGQVIRAIAGGKGTGPNGGTSAYGRGGNGIPETHYLTGWAGGGGGASAIYLDGVLLAVAGGGGGDRYAGGTYFPNLDWVSIPGYLSGTSTHTFKYTGHWISNDEQLITGYQTSCVEMEAKGTANWWELDDQMTPGGFYFVAQGGYPGMNGQPGAGGKTFIRRSFMVPYAKYTFGNPGNGNNGGDGVKAPGTWYQRNTKVTFSGGSGGGGGGYGGGGSGSTLWYTYTNTDPAYASINNMGSVIGLGGGGGGNFRSPKLSTSSATLEQPGMFAGTANVTFT
ncbi:hypothetical protein DCS_02037 [Drechmeria coniospora]|uniref:Uncharacterized protein n=1 Tax=Drechmeria coniospora TaxID=98403 RepID=A0A151GUY2_DRECN|nr:hypothetical protein DCS_02037 [Drechmeria coniospora]KYK60898.1 hypothetical protein DCS_02037 [Drechmeria coniospora]